MMRGWVASLLAFSLSVWKKEQEESRVRPRSSSGLMDGIAPRLPCRFKACRNVGDFLSGRVDGHRPLCSTSARRKSEDRWLSGRKHTFAKGAYLTRVPRV